MGTPVQRSLLACPPQPAALADPDELIEAEFRLAMAEPARFSFSAESDFANERFCRIFYRLALMNHVFNRYILTTKVFENLLAASIRGGGRPVWEPASRTHPFDLLLEDSDERISAKTETGKTIKREEITISKLIELSDGRMPRTPAEAARFAREEIPAILEHAERMIIMRAFQVTDDHGRRAIEYLLLEVPKRLFSALGQACEAEVTVRGQTLTLPLKLAGDLLPVLELKFDTSVRKVTVKKLRTCYCLEHASFTVPYGEEVVAAAAAA